MIVLHALGMLFTYAWRGLLFTTELPFHLLRLGFAHPVVFAAVALFTVAGVAYGARRK